MRPRLGLILQNPSIPYVYDAAGRECVDVVEVHLPSVAPRASPPVQETIALDPFEARDEALAELVRLHRVAPFAGVLTLFEPAVPFTAELVGHLGLPGLGVPAAQACRDKRRQRAVLGAAGLHVPRYALVDGPDDAEDALALVGLPAVVKPRNGMASQGVTRVDTVTEARRAIQLVTAINDETLEIYADSARGEPVGVLLEEYVDGPEFCVESLTHEGTTWILAIAYKGDLAGPLFEESIYITPPRLPEIVADHICAEVRRAHQALDITAGAAHTELRLRGGTTPVILEVGARMGGSGVVHRMVEQSSGVDFARLVVQVALGRSPTPVPPERPRPRATAANWIVPLGGHGRYAGLTAREEVLAHLSTTEVLEFLTPGDDVPAWPRFRGYPGFVLSRHQGYDECRAYHAWLGEVLRTRWASAPGET